METVKEFLNVKYVSGSGYGSGYGSGSGSGSGYGSGYGYGDGYGSGYRYAPKTYNGKAVYAVDGIQTIIDKVRFGFGIGSIVNSDLTLTPCFIAKRGNLFAHGRTMQEARTALIEKLFDDMSEEDRIAAFWECHNRTDKYSGRDLWEWHHKLTGSCEMGRNQFAIDHGIDIDNSEFTVAEFVDLCENDYGGATIKKLRDGGDQDART